MKTAMQELIENLSSGVKIVLEKELKQALEKEKEQIVRAYQVGAINNYDKAKWINLTPEYFEICGKEYFLKHFNQNQ